jgi:hypothetical protein
MENYYIYRSRKSSTAIENITLLKIGTEAIPKKSDFRSIFFLSVKFIFSFLKSFKKSFII